MRASTLYPTCVFTVLFKYCAWNCCVPSLYVFTALRHSKEISYRALLEIPFTCGTTGCLRFCCCSRCCF